MLANDEKLKHKKNQSHCMHIATSVGESMFSQKSGYLDKMAAVSAILERKQLNLRTRIAHVLVYTSTDFERRMTKNAGFRRVQVRF